MEQMEHIRPERLMRGIEPVVEKPVKVKPPRLKRVAHVTELCTGCGGSPVCAIYCKSHALDLVDDPENYPFKIMRVDAVRCTGCGACVSRGTMGALTTGCPWSAIDLLSAKEVRTIH